MWFVRVFDVAWTQYGDRFLFYFILFDGRRRSSHPGRAGVRCFGRGAVRRSDTAPAERRKTARQNGVRYRRCRLRWNQRHSGHAGRLEERLSN